MNIKKHEYKKLTWIWISDFCYIWATIGAYSILNFAGQGDKLKDD